MLKILLPVVFLMFFNACCNSSCEQKTKSCPESKSHENKLLWKQEGFIHPESIAEYNQDLYVSNIGNDDSKPDGFISKVSKESGEILKLKWCDSLYSPKGIAFSGAYLYVADLTNLCKIDTSSGKIVEKYSKAEVGMFNDVAIDGKGNVYVSDMVQSAIYKLDTLGTLERIYQDDILYYPNGLLCVDNELYIGGWGRLDDSRTEQDSIGRFWVLNLQTIAIRSITNKLGKLDGIQLKGDGFLVSSWKAGQILTINKEGEHKVVFETEESVGDFYYDKLNNKIFLPLNFQNRIEAYSF